MDEIKLKPFPFCGTPDGKAVLISIRPEWVEKITNGKKTIEVRKTRPKLETPFKVYIYCTKQNNIMLWNARSYIYVDDHTPKGTRIRYF